MLLKNTYTILKKFGVISAALLFISASAEAARYYVKTDGSDTAVGTAWETAFKTIAKALSICTGADDGDEIWIKEGTYAEGSTVYMKNNVALYGGFAGTEDDKSQRTAAHETILSGENSYRIMGIYFGDNVITAENTLINRITFKNGYNQYASAIYIENSNLKISECNFYNNTATVSGTLYIFDASPTLSECNFNGNSVQEAGGGIFLTSSLRVRSSDFSDNEESVNIAIKSYNSHPKINSCNFIGNKASDGGAIFSYYSYIEISLSDFKGNEAARGGAIGANGGDNVINSCHFEDNKSSYGGAVYGYYSNYIINSCAFFDNSAINGGATAAYYGSLMLSNGTFLQNFATNYGAGTYNKASQAGIINCTFTDNKAGSSGGAIRNVDSDVNVVNSIFLNNKARDLISPYYSDADSTFKIAYCLSDSQTLEIQNPLLLPANYYKGRLARPLQEGSPAIAAGATQAQADEQFGQGVLAIPQNDALGNARDTSLPCALGAVDYDISLSPNAVAVKEAAYIFSKNYEFTLMAYAAANGATYQWYKNGTEIEGATMPHLKTAQDESEASYICKISYADTSADTQAIIVKTSDLQILHISPDGDDANDGHSWQTPKKSIQAAIDALYENGTYGSEVWLKEGVYEEGKPVEMKNSIGIYGGFAGTEDDKSQRTAAHETILSGENSYGVVSNEYSIPGIIAASTVLDSVTISNGKAANGGGINNTFANPTISNCVFTGNSASKEGGAIYNAMAFPLIINCTFANNSATLNGGAMYNEYSLASVINSTFSQNSASSGGAVFNYGIGSKLLNCTLYNNTATQGKAIHVASSNLNSATNCIIWDNSEDGQALITTASTAAISVNYCAVKGGYAGTGNIDADPKLMPLGNYGGTLETMPVDEDSPAIGAGATPTQLKTLLGSDTASLAVNDALGRLRPEIECSTIGAVEYILVSDIHLAEGSDAAYEGGEALFEIISDSEGLSYKWQRYDAANEEWVDIEGATSNTLLLSDVNASMSGAQYRCIVSDRLYSEEINVSLQVRATAHITTQPKTPYDRLDEELRVEAIGYDLHYQWQIYDADAKTWEDIEGASAAALPIDFANFNNRDIFRCAVSNAAAGLNTVYSESAAPAETTIFITADISDKTVYEKTPLTLSVETLNLGSKKPIYTWYLDKRDGKAPSKVGTAAALKITPALASDGYEYYCVVSNVTHTAISATAKLKVLPLVKIAAQPKANVAYSGGVTTLSINASDNTEDPTLYLWQIYKQVRDVRTNKLVWQWVDVAEGEYGTSGADTSTLTFGDIDYALNGAKFRCVVSNGGSTYASNGASLSVRETAYITVQPSDVVAEVGEAAKFAVGAKGTASIRYQWYASTDSGATWGIINKATGSSYSLSKLTKAQDGTMLKCNVWNDDTNKTLWSDAVTLYVNRKTSAVPTLTAVTVFNEENASNKFTVLAEAENSIRYKIERLPLKANSKTGWVSVEEGLKDAASATISYGISAPVIPGEKYRVTVWSGRFGEGSFEEALCRKIVSKEITVAKSLAKTTVALASNNLPECFDYAQCPAKFAVSNYVATLSVTAKGSGLAYQWYESADSGATWSALADVKNFFAGSKTAKLTITKPTGDGFSKLYKCAITNAGGAVESEVIALKKLAEASVASSPQNKNYYEGYSATLTVEASADCGARTTYKWMYQKPTDASTKWTAVSGGNKSVLTLTKLTYAQSGYKYRCEISNALNVFNKTPAISDYATITITYYSGTGSVSATTNISGNYSASFHSYISIGGIQSAPTITFNDNESYLANLSNTLLFSGASSANNEFSLDINAQGLVSLKYIVANNDASYKWFISYDGVAFTEIEGESSSTLLVDSAIFTEAPVAAFKLEVRTSKGGLNTNAITIRLTGY